MPRETYQRERLMIPLTVTMTATAGDEVAIDSVTMRGVELKWKLTDGEMQILVDEAAAGLAERSSDVEAERYESRAQREALLPSQWGEP